MAKADLAALGKQGPLFICGVNKWNGTVVKVYESISMKNVNESSYFEQNFMPYSISLNQLIII